MEKLVIPCRKNIYRLVGADGKPLVDIMLMADEPQPVVGERILCRHPFMENKRAYVTPSGVVPLLQLVWDGPKGGLQIPVKPLPEVRLMLPGITVLTCIVMMFSFVFPSSHIYNCTIRQSHRHRHSHTHTFKLTVAH